MAVSTRTYASGAIAFGGQPVINDLKAAGYDTVIVWSVHVNSTGDLYLNDTGFVSNGVYKEQQKMNLPEHLASLRQGGKVRILFSVGSGGVSDWTNIQKLLGPGPDNILYKNFDALLKAMQAPVGGGIDGVDYDNEDNLNASVMVVFGAMLAKIGYPHVTLCPYSQADVWTDTLQQLESKVKAGFVSAIHLQCYSGGGGNDPATWIKEFNEKMGGGFDAASLMMAGLSTSQNSSSQGTYTTTWWNTHTTPPEPGACVHKKGQYGNSDWSGYLSTVSKTTPDAAMQTAQANGAVTFFFYCNQALKIGEHVLAAGDAVFFTGAPTWASLPQCDSYYLDCNCSTSIGYNPPLAADGCPSALVKQYNAWKTGDSRTTPGGGFIWLYDSVMTCLTSSCCGGSVEHPVATATAFRKAITDGLS